MLDVEEWAEIRRLHVAEGVSIKEIARRLGVARNTVRSAVRSASPPKFDRKRRPSAVDAVEPRIRELLGEFPRMPATVIAERIGWDRPMTILKARVRELRPLFVAPDPTQRTEYRPGELAQWDLWFPPAKIPPGYAQEASPPVIVGVLGYSRTITGRMVPSREAHDILGGHLECLVDLGGVPRNRVYDNETALVSRHNGRANLSEPFQRFRGTLGMGVIVCRPGDPEAKGLVERANGYLETSFLPGRSLDALTTLVLLLVGLAVGGLSSRVAREYRHTRARRADTAGLTRVLAIASEGCAEDVEMSVRAELLGLLELQDWFSDQALNLVSLDGRRHSQHADDARRG